MDSITPSKVLDDFTSLLFESKFAELIVKYTATKASTRVEINEINISSDNRATHYCLNENHVFKTIDKIDGND